MLARHEWANSASGAVPVVLIRGGITKADFKTAAALQRLGDEDDTWRDERAADPLNCLRIDAKPSGDLAHTGPSRSRQGLTDSFSGAKAIGVTPAHLAARTAVSESRRGGMEVV